MPRNWLYHPTFWLHRGGQGCLWRRWLLAAILAAAGIGPGRLGFELREPVLAGDWESTRRMATMLASRGHPLALDDFRDAPLHILSRMPFTSVKVGANVMRLVRSSGEWRAFLRSVAAAARSLGSTTVAEYVEDEEVLEVVLEAGIELGQGHLFGPALEFDRVCASDHY